MSTTRILVTAVLASLAACTQTPPAGTPLTSADQTAPGPASSPRLVQSGEHTGAFSGVIALLAKDGTVRINVPLVGTPGSGTSNPIGSVETVPYLAQTATPRPGGGVAQTLGVNYVETGFKATRIAASDQSGGAVYDVWYGRLAPGSVPSDGVIKGKPVVLTYTKAVTVPFDGSVRTERLIPQNGAPVDLAPEIRFSAAPMKRFVLVP